MKKKKIGIVYDIQHENQMDELKVTLTNEGCAIREIRIDNDETVPADEEPEIPIEIEEIIDWLDILMVMLDKDSEDDKLIEEEIEEAYKRGKTIVGVFPKGGAGGIGFPPNFKKRRNYTISYDSIDRIPDILHGTHVPHENPDGSKNEPTYKVHTVKC